MKAKLKNMLWGVNLNPRTPSASRVAAAMITWKKPYELRVLSQNFLLAYIVHNNELNCTFSYMCIMYFDHMCLSIALPHWSSSSSSL